MPAETIICFLNGLKWVSIFEILLLIILTIE
ncbi:uncharacterized protein METZ01_LOCUS174426 [marine metagenome]|uniref:Uncharacterized protein n=1 Tax=marine metagenome TaxID=408172 RepID=A0A382C716_9ZZZZ